jgi:Phosphotransferase enzyme family
MDEGQSTVLMAETLQEGLSHLWGRPVRVQQLRRQPFARSSSFQAEWLNLVLDGGEPLEVFFKDLDPRHLINGAAAVRPGDIGPSRRELSVYQQFLAGQRCGTPELYAWRWDPPGGACWLFLEAVRGPRLAWEPDFGLWLAAARWAAGFHAATRRVPAVRTDFLPHYGRAQYLDCAERIERKFSGLEAAYRPAVRRALECYRGLIDGFGALPHSVIHGEFFGKNIVVRAGDPNRPLAVVDWESAALGPSYLDLVSIAAGKWGADQKQALWRAYFDVDQAGTGLRLDWESFRQDLGRLALHHTLKWLAWRPDWDFSLKRWLAELDQALAGLG